MSAVLTSGRPTPHGSATPAAGERSVVVVEVARLIVAPNEVGRSQRTRPRRDKCHAPQVSHVRSTTHKGLVPKKKSVNYASIRPRPPAARRTGQAEVDAGRC